MIKLESDEDVKAWIWSHDAEIKEKWTAQYRFNKQVNASLDEADSARTHINSRLDKLEKRMIYIVATAAAGGGGVGYMIMQLLGLG